MVLAKKKDGTFRFCVDTRGLNNASISDAYPLPKISQCLDSLGGSKIFSTLDLTNYYHQLEIHPGDTHKTAFISRKGLHEFLVVPMGYKNSTAMAQKTMDIVLSGVSFFFSLAYLDDVVVYSRDVPTHLEHLREVFMRFRAANLKFKPEKCSFLRTEIHFLGFKVSRKGIAPDESKIKKIVDWPVPKNLTESRGFVGLVTYYKRHLPSFGELTRPLTLLTRKNQPFVWTKECQESFEQLKKLLSSAPIVGIPQDEGEWILDTDASDRCISCVLSQIQGGKEVVIAYDSRVLDPREISYSVTRRELLAVVVFVKKYKHFLLGRRFTLRTDHSALQYLFTCAEPIGQMARWSETLALTLKFHTERGPCIPMPTRCRGTPCTPSPQSRTS